MPIYRLYFCLCLIAVMLTIAIRPSANNEQMFVKQRSFEFNYSTSVEVPEGSSSAQLWLPVPKSDANQQITALEVKSQYPISFLMDKEYGNSALVVTSNNPKPGKFTVEMTFQITRQENINRLTSMQKTIKKEVKEVKEVIDDDLLMRRWLEPDKLVPISQRVKDLAIELTKGKDKDEEKLRAIYYYVADNLKYDKSGMGWGRGDIYFACDEKRGNCTDFHALTIGLCRAVGIAARFAIGFSIPTDKGEGQIMGYHCWAESYIKGKGWIPMDVSEASKNPQLKDYYFGAHDENRVEFSIGRDIALPGIHSEPLNFFIYPYAEINQKPTDKVERKFTFKSL